MLLDMVAEAEQDKRMVVTHVVAGSRPVSHPVAMVNW